MNPKALKKVLIVVSLFLTALAAQARELQPDRVREVSTPGPQLKVFDGQKYKKVSSITEYQYDHVQVESEKGPRDVLTLDINARTVGFSIVIYGENRNETYVHELVDPAKREIISDSLKEAPQILLDAYGASLKGQMVSVNNIMGEPRELNKNSVTPVPNTDRVKIVPGTWRFSIGTRGLNPGPSNSFRVSVFVKRSSSLNEETLGQVNLQAFASESSKIADTLVEMEEYLDLNSSFLEEVGIKLNVLASHRLSQKFASICDDFTRPCSEGLKELMSTNPGIELIPGALRAFFIERGPFANNGLATVGGAVSSLFENNKDVFDGAFIWNETFSLEAGRQKSSRVFVHELSHQLGLYHTELDNISDSKDINHWIEGNQGAKEIGIMSSGYGEGPFSPGQKYVLLRSVAVELYQPEQ